MSARLVITGLKRILVNPVVETLDFGLACRKLGLSLAGVDQQNTSVTS